MSTLEIPKLPNGSIDYNTLNNWYTDNTVVRDCDAFRLRSFTKFNSEKDSVLILPPQAGHTSQIADYGKGKSITRCAVDNTDCNVFTIDWKSCTKTRAGESYGDMVDQVLDCIDKINTSVHLIGLCQGGTLAAVTTALHQDKIKTVTIAGAPIYVDREGVLKEAIRNPLYMFQLAVMMGGGVMRGELMLECWMSSNPVQHRMLRFQEPVTYRKARFDAWYYEATQNIAGNWYLDLVENLFKGNKLYKGEFEVGGETVNLGNITCPLNLVVGTKDDISPVHHTLKMADVVNSVKVNIYSGKAGHISVFMGSDMLTNNWTKLFKEL